MSHEDCGLVLVIWGSFLIFCRWVLKGGDDDKWT